MIATDSAPLIGVAAGAVVAAAGYVGKLAIESWGEWRRAEAQSLAQLFKLQALLRASGAAYLVQRELAERLKNQLKAAHPEDVPKSPGLERLFSHLHSRFRPEEAELHEIIRAYTEHALLPINETLAEWLRNDVRYRVARPEMNEPEIRLAELLNQLDAHLLLWFAKYRRWLPDRPDHALVYLHDEEEHGLGFPKGIEQAAQAVLAERQTKSKKLRRQRQNGQPRIDTPAPK